MLRLIRKWLKKMIGHRKLECMLIGMKDILIMSQKRMSKTNKILQKLDMRSLKKKTVNKIQH